MAQLIVKDLDFCEVELSKLKGGGWDIETKVQSVTGIKVHGPQVGAALAVAGGVVAGNNSFIDLLVDIGII